MGIVGNDMIFSDGMNKTKYAKVANGIGERRSWKKKQKSRAGR
jgi:hypothetical protein